MTKVVYACYGAYEDFVYAGSWEQSRLVTCSPNTQVKYPKDRQIYSSEMLRGFVFLVEMAFQKEPPVVEFGDDKDWNS